MGANYRSGIIVIRARTLEANTQYSFFFTTVDNNKKEITQQSELETRYTRDWGLSGSSRTITANRTNVISPLYRGDQLWGMQF
jgi:hypothetical protein